MQMWVWSLGREEPLEKEMAAHSSIRAWEIPWTEEPGRPWSMESQRVGHDFTSAQLHSHVQLFVTPWTTARQVLPVPHQLPEFTQTHVHWVGGAIQPSHPLSSPSPPALNLAQHQGLFKLALRIRWPKYWNFSFNISPSNQHSGLISFRMDLLDLLAVQGTLKSLLQHQFKSINSSVLSFLYSPTLTSTHDTGKTIALTRRTFVDKVMSLLDLWLNKEQRDRKTCQEKTVVWAQVGERNEK